MTTPTTTPRRRLPLTVQILIAMGAGAGCGLALEAWGTEWLSNWLVEGLFAMLGTMFLNALKMLVVPLVFFSLLCGVTGIGDLGALGRVGGKALGLYLLTTAIAISSAILIALAIAPGEGFDLGTAPVDGFTDGQAPSLWETFAAIVPDNPVAAFAGGEMLQIIFYTIVLGIAVLMLGARSKPFVAAAAYMNEVMMKIVTIVMTFAPVGVFALIARSFAEQGAALFLPVLAYVGTLLLALAVHLFVTQMALLKLFSGLNPLIFLRDIHPAQVFAFSTASSTATIPVTLRAVTERIGVSQPVAAFTVPFGATINMDGTAIMQGVATVFLAHVYGIEPGLSGYLGVIVMAVLASIGTAGVPGVGTVMLTMVLTEVGLPIEGIALILGVDRLMDMARTVVNVTGDAVVTAIVARSEGALDLRTFANPKAGEESDALHINPRAKKELAKIAAPR